MLLSTTPLPLLLGTRRAQLNLNIARDAFGVRKLLTDDAARVFLATSLDGDLAPCDLVLRRRHSIICSFVADSGSAVEGHVQKVTDCEVCAGERKGEQC